MMAIERKRELSRQPAAEQKGALFQNGRWSFQVRGNGLVDGVGGKMATCRR
jgi:hypothetical protein